MVTQFSIASFDNKFAVMQGQKKNKNEVAFQSKIEPAKTQFVRPNNNKAQFDSFSKTNKLSFGTQFTQNERIARTVAEVLYSFRKQDSYHPCKTNPCPTCCDAIAAKVRPFIEKAATIPGLIICYPFKSASRLKTISPHADKAEELSLRRLERIMSEVDRVYTPGGSKPGTDMTIYSDSLVFSTTPTNPSDAEARQYGRELKSMISRMGLDNRIHYRTMEDVDFLNKPGIPKDLAGRRQWLKDNYGSEYTEPKIKERMANDVHYRNFVGSIQKFNEQTMKGIHATAGEEALQRESSGGITMFVDDRDYITFIDTTTGRAIDNGDPRVAQAVKVVNAAGKKALGERFNNKEEDLVKVSNTSQDQRFRLRATNEGARQISQLAYEVLHLDQSWVSLINKQTADKVRFSMHPQPCGSFKTGIELVEGSGWIGPWQSCAIDLKGLGHDNDFVLSKNATAKRLGCIVEINKETGYPSHYVLPQNHPNIEDAIKELSTKR